MSVPAHKMKDVEGFKSRSLVAIKAAGNPSDDQLTLINDYALAELTADQVYVRTAYLAHNAIDRDGDVFDEALLADFAKTLPGKGLFIKHPRSWDGDTGPGTGRWFAAKVVEMSLDEARAALREPNLQWAPGTEKAYLLEASYFIPRSGKNADLIVDIDAGVASDVSIGFRASDRTAIQDASQNTIAYRLHAPGEAVEGSLVWLGAQPGARTVKHFNSGTHTEEDPMNEEEIKALQSKVSNLQKQVDDNKAAATALDAIRKAVGDDLADNPQRLATMVNDAKSYRDDLIGQIVTGERHLGMVGDSEEAQTAAKSMYADVDISVLKSRAKAVGSKVDNAETIEGGDANTAGDKGARDEQDKGGKKDYSSPLDNPAVVG